MAGIVIHGDDPLSTAFGIAGAAAEGVVEGARVRAELDERIAKTKERQQKMELLAKAAQLKDAQDAAQAEWNKVRAGVPGAPADQGDVMLDHPTVNFSPAELRVFKDLSPEGQSAALLDLQKRREKADKDANIAKSSQWIAAATGGVGLYNGGQGGHSSPIAQEFYKKAEEALELYASDDEASWVKTRGTIRRALRGAADAQQDLLEREKMANWFAMRQQEIINKPGEDGTPGAILSERDQAELEKLKEVWEKYHAEEYTEREAAAFANIPAEDLEIITRRTVSQYELMRQEEERKRAQFERDRARFEAIRRGETPPPATAPPPAQGEQGEGPDPEQARLSGVPFKDWIGPAISELGEEATDAASLGFGVGHHGLTKAEALQRDLADAIENNPDATEEERRQIVGTIMGQHGVHGSIRDALELMSMDLPSLRDLKMGAAEAMSADVRALLEEHEKSKKKKAEKKKEAERKKREASAAKKKKAPETEGPLSKRFGGG